MNEPFRDLLIDLAGRLPQTAEQVCGGLDQRSAERAPAPGANTICWLLWHSARCIDAQLHAITGGEQLWSRWKPRLAIDLPDDRLGVAELGYAQSPADAAQVVAPVVELRAYLLECCGALTAHCAEVGAEQLAAIVDEAWDPPVTHGVRLISIIDDVIQHLGAAAYLRGGAQGDGQADQRSEQAGVPPGIRSRFSAISR